MPQAPHQRHQVSPPVIYNLGGSERAHSCYTVTPSTMPVQINSEVIVKPVRAIVSASYLYPLKGIYYFLAHPAFYPLFGRRLFPLVVTSIIVLGLLFTFTYLPQVAFLAIFNGHLAWFNAAFLVLGEGQVAISLLFEAFLVDETLVDVFDVRTPP